jgi:hypothetical protein
VGLAFQYRIDPAVVPEGAVVSALRRLLDLPTEAVVAGAGGHAPARRGAGP